MAIMRVLLGLFICAEAAPTHPTLPTMWTATVKEFEVGVVQESEHFVMHPTKSNISAKWTNYTDGSCQRLIYQPELAATRYLLGCESVDCCVEDGEGPIEYQIPNVHPSILAPVHYNGKENLTKFDGSTVQADKWCWRFGPEGICAWTTTDGQTGSATLHQWVPTVAGTTYPNEYVDYKAVPAGEEAFFMATFGVPDKCKAPNTPKCNDLHQRGLLSDKSLAFVKAGTMRAQPPVIV